MSSKVSGTMSVLIRITAPLLLTEFLSACSRCSSPLLRITVGISVFAVMVVVDASTVGPPFQEFCSIKCYIYWFCDHQRSC